VPHTGDAFPQRRGRPDGSSRRVVQLVREARGELPEREQPLALTDDGLGVAQPHEQALEQMHRQGEPLAQQLGELRGGELDEASVLRRADGVEVDLRHLVAGIGSGRPGVDPAVGRTDQLDLAVTHPAGHGDLAVEERVEAGGLLALVVEHLTGGDGHHAGERHEGSQLRVVESLEEEQRPQLFGGDPLHGLLVGGDGRLDRVVGHVVTLSM
jgi:hypothetical protein